MSRNTTITLDEVRSAIERIEARGEKPTYERVRKELGGRGSLTTIAKHIKTLRGAELPDRVTEAVQVTFRELRAALEEEMDEVRRDADEAIAEARKATADAEAAQARAEEMARVAQEGQAAAERLREGLAVDLAAERERRAAEERRASDLQQQLAGLLIALDGERAGAAGLRAELEARGRDLAHTQGEVQQLRGEVGARDQLLSQQREAQERQAQELAQARGEVQQLRGALAAKDREIEEIRMELARAREGHDQVGELARKIELLDQQLRGRMDVIEQLVTPKPSAKPSRKAAAAAAASAA